MKWRVLQRSTWISDCGRYKVRKARAMRNYFGYVGEFNGERVCLEIDASEARRKCENHAQRMSAAPRPDANASAAPASTATSA